MKNKDVLNELNFKGWLMGYICLTFNANDSVYMYNVCFTIYSETYEQWIHREQDIVRCRERCPYLVGWYIVSRKEVWFTLTAACMYIRELLRCIITTL